MHPGLMNINAALWWAFVGLFISMILMLMAWIGNRGDVDEEKVFKFMAIMTIIFGLGGLLFG